MQPRRTYAEHNRAYALAYKARARDLRDAVRAAATNPTKEQTK